MNSELKLALDEVVLTFSQYDGFQGAGQTKTASGLDAIIVYSRDEQLLQKLPTSVKGFPVIGEVIGEVRPL